MGNSRSLNTVPRRRAFAKAFFTRSAATRRVFCAERTRMIPSANRANSTVLLNDAAGAATIEYSKSLRISAIYVHSDGPLSEPASADGSVQTFFRMRVATLRTDLCMYMAEVRREFEY